MKYTVVLALVLIAGCATTSQFIRLQIGMTKNQVIEAIGEPDLARGSLQNKYGQLVEVWEYDRLVSNWAWDRKLMWVYLHDGKLVQWGQAGDWRREADRIYEMRFR
jgi:hypothetical protein